MAVVGIQASEATAWITLWPVHVLHCVVRCRAAAGEERQHGCCMPGPPAQIALRVPFN